MSFSVSEAIDLTAEDFARIMRRAGRKDFAPGQRIFSEGDTADEMYFIESGRVSIVIDEFTRQEEIGVLEPGEYFGEMAFFCNDRRSASAIALQDTTLLCLYKAAFVKMYESDPDIAAKIDGLLARRSRELAYKEILVDHPGIRRTNLRIGIKGDPSLRESAFFRERYESVVDKFLPLLQPQLYDILIHRSAYEVSIHFNSGELHIGTVFDPFNHEVHPAAKLVNKAYVQRHFPAVGYAEKALMLRRVYDFLGADPGFEFLPEHARTRLRDGFRAWQPLSPLEVARVLSRLPQLRTMANFYLRNFTISTMRDALRMQFNCDGAHIIGVDDYEAFLEQNMPPVETLGEQGAERRMADRRALERRTDAAPRVNIETRLGERRTPPGRRRKDWDVYARSLEMRTAGGCSSAGG